MSLLMRDVVASKIVFIVAGLLVATLAGFVFAGMQHQAAAKAFWGSEYNPTDHAQVRWGFPANFFMPSGGPMIATSLAPSCSDTPLPMVPVKFNADGSGQVLCGIGRRTMAMGFNVSQIDDRDLRNYILDAIAQEQELARQRPAFD